MSLAALQAHLETWMREADGRVHGTTHQRPCEAFQAQEKQALRPLPPPSLPARQRRLKRRVANDAFVDVDTVRYSAPYRLVKETVEVLVGTEVVRVLHDGLQVAQHPRRNEPYAKVVDPAHHEGLWRRLRETEVPTPADVPKAPIEMYQRSLAEYAQVVEGGER